MRRLMLLACLAIAGCGQSGATVEVKPMWPQLKTGSPGIIAGKAFVDIFKTTYDPDPKEQEIAIKSGFSRVWQKSDPEYSFPHVHAGDRLIVLNDQAGNNTPDRLVDIKVESGDWEGGTYKVERQYVMNTPAE